MNHVLLCTLTLRDLGPKYQKVFAYIQIDTNNIMVGIYIRFGISYIHILECHVLYCGRLPLTFDVM